MAPVSVPPLLVLGVLVMLASSARGVALGQHARSDVDLLMPACGIQCQLHGSCREGICECEIGWKGTDCNELVCPNNCSDNGLCEHGSCTCDYGFSGPDCSFAESAGGDSKQIAAATKCMPTCQNGGECMSGFCMCKRGYQGDACEQSAGETGASHGVMSTLADLAVPCADINDCSGHGLCLEKKCRCYGIWSGDFCSVLTCPNNCHGHGTCDKGTCSCQEGFAGSSCKEMKCPDNCSGHGKCNHGVCVCDESFVGDRCQSHTCPFYCSGNGLCQNGTCKCFPGWTGEACAQQPALETIPPAAAAAEAADVLPTEASTTSEDAAYAEAHTAHKPHHKKLVTPISMDLSETSARSETTMCLHGCNQNGVCKNGNCVCDKGFSGPDCSGRACPGNCSEHGLCVKGDCFCKNGWTGEDCGVNVKDEETRKHRHEDQKHHCSVDCGPNGQCLGDECMCKDGWQGTKCDFSLCKNMCSANGVCRAGKCVCLVGWTGEDCSEATKGAERISQAPKPARPSTGSKRRINRASITDSLQTMDFLEEKDFHKNEKHCPSDCNSDAQQGLCDYETGTCMCKDGFTGASCDTVRECPKGCSGNGECNPKTKLCTCKSGWGGHDCATRLCPNDCSGNGLCGHGQCLCKDGFMGDDCNISVCPGGCSNGQCKNGRCWCLPGWAGAKCAERMCPHECSNNGFCRGGTCFCKPGFVGVACEFYGRVTPHSHAVRVLRGTGPNSVLRRTPVEMGEQPGASVEKGVEPMTPERAADEAVSADLESNPNHGHAVENSQPGGAGKEEPALDASGVPPESTEIDTSMFPKAEDFNKIGRYVAKTFKLGAASSDTDKQYRQARDPADAPPPGELGGMTNSTEAAQDDQGVSPLEDPEAVLSSPIDDGGLTDELKAQGETVSRNANEIGSSDERLTPEGAPSGDLGILGQPVAYPKGCPANCNSQGVCFDGHCYCYDGFVGQECNIRTRCVNDCNAPNGHCFNGTCACSVGFEGADCGIRQCLNGCSGHGTCTPGGMCMCDGDYEGHDCSRFRCPANCNSNGYCDGGACACYKGLAGETCNRGKIAVKRDCAEKCVSKCRSACKTKDTYNVKLEREAAAATTAQNADQAEAKATADVTKSVEELQAAAGASTPEQAAAPQAAGEGIQATPGTK